VTESKENAVHEATLLHLSIEKSQSLLKWSPGYQFDKAVHATGEWYQRVQNGEDAISVTRQQIQDFIAKN